jgi:hypothetical protein
VAQVLYEQEPDKVKQEVEEHRQKMKYTRSVLDANSVFQKYFIFTKWYCQ